MTKSAILNGNIYPRIGLGHAPTENHELLNNTSYKAQLAAQFLVYDRVVVPTSDLGIVPILIDWMGIDTVCEALETDSLGFVRHNKSLGYAGNGGGLVLFAVNEGDSRKFQWWQTAMYGQTSDAIDLQLGNSCPELAEADRTKLYDMVLSKTTDFTIDNDAFMREVVHESYVDLSTTEELASAVANYNQVGQKLDLARLPGVAPNQMRIWGIENPKDAVDLILRVAEINLDIQIATQAQNADLFTSERTKSILKNKLKRFQLGHDLLDGFMDLLELTNVPNIESAIVNSALSFDDLWKARSSKNAIEFRKWLRKAAIGDAQELSKAYVANLENVPAVEALPTKSLRFLVTAAAGIFGPAIALPVAAIDNFFVKKWLSGYAPKLFIDEMRKLTIDKRVS